ncbi:DUF4835 family protein [Chitinophaga sp. GCM10012297]|uniref:DUF4835 family protein n=1 Tax=Chitinophaga chungangae TaxID=2821488 RepID=A0ABS3Y7N1_9BACT|nr:DUF4835 family protein [Chitinophaga chungangae]MBO9150626.1 DUF4835 family protein [Chitinophaga chungangae]
MFRKTVLCCLYLLACCFNAGAQELRANVTVQASPQLGNSTDRRVFNTLQTAMAEFINNRRWSDDAYAPGERIECNYMLTISEALGNNTFRGSLTVQAARPVYNSSYNSSILNIQDANVVFQYVEFQPLEFNEQRIVGNNPLQSNLTAILAFYNYIVIGLDADSFAPRGGDVFFKKALNIVNNAPDGKDISGWKAFEGNRNRYWIQDNLLNTKFSAFHDVMYQYHRLGLDMMYEDVNKGRAAIMNCLNMLTGINADQPNSMIVQQFFLAKSDELLKVFSKAPPQEKVRAGQLLASLDVPNANKYQQLR